MKTPHASVFPALPRLAALVLFSHAGLTPAQDAPQKAEGAFAPKAKEILESVTAFFAKTEALSVDAVMKIDQTMPESAGGGEQKMEMIQTLSLQRPGSFSLVTKGDSGMSASAYAIDGQMSIVIDRDTVIEGKFEGELAEVFKSEKFAYNVEGDSNPLLDQNTAAAFVRELIFNSTKHPWDKNVTAMRYDGEEEIDGQKAHKLTLTSTQKQGPGGGDLEIDIALWIAAGEQPIPLRIVPDTSKIIAAMTKENEAFAGMKVDITGTYTNWSIDKAPRESAFRADFNDDADRYEDFAAFLAAMNEQDGGAAGDPTTLVGEDAPDFEIAMLDGSSFKLSELKGKKTVILDFWATWCGPCVQALPILRETAGAFAGKDVILVAVNQGEDNATISDFLKKKKWDDLRVALDTEGTVAGQYMVSGIPQTVIVGKDGKVKKVHVGFAPDLKETLTKELDAVTAE
jgi:thiol-disulfide isomerase/thioredoxin